MPSPAKKVVSAKAASANTTASINKAAQATLSAVESSRNSAENVVKISTEAMKEFFANGAEETQKAHEKVFAMGRESAEQLAKGADASAKMINEVISIGRENIDACVECGNIAAGITKTISTELFNITNDLFTENLEVSKEIFSCRTFNDLFELQARISKDNIDSMFNATMKISELCFQFATETAEPINERVAEATERFSRTLAAA